MSDIATTTAPATPDATTTAPPPTPNWNEFVDGLSKLSSDLGGKLDTLVGEVKGLPPQLTPPPQAPAPPDYDSMSRPELVAHIVGTIGEQMKAAIADALKPVAERLGGVETQVVTGTVTQQLERARAEHKDFNDWKDEMVGLAKTHPSLSIPQLYALARAENPTKAADRDKHYSPPAPPPAPRWGGLLPTATGNGATPPLSARDAGLEAYREVQARHPGILAALEGM
jgi:hypothetical protein